MIRHVVAFRFRPGVPEPDQDRLLDELRALPGHFPQILDFALGVNISDRDDRFTHAFSAQFRDEGEMQAYLKSERHERFVQEQFRPLVEERAIVSFEAP